MVNKYRVIQWGTGVVGTNALRMMARKQSVEIVGAIVGRPERAGKDESSSEDLGSDRSQGKKA